MSLTKQLRKSIILVTLKNELKILENFTTPAGYVCRYELFGFNISVSFETTASICTVFGEPMDLGDSITDIIVTHIEIDDGTFLNASDLTNEMVKTLLEKADLMDCKNNLL